MCISPSNVYESYHPGSDHVNEAITDSPLQRRFNKITKVALLILAPLATLVFLPHPIGYFPLIISVIFLFKEFCCAQDGSQDNTRIRDEDEARRIHHETRRVQPFPETSTDPNTILGANMHRLRRYPSSTTTLGMTSNWGSLTSLHIPVGRGQIPQQPQERAPRATAQHTAPIRNISMPNISDLRSAGIHVSVGSRPFAAAQPIMQHSHAQLPTRNGTVYTPPSATRDEWEDHTASQRLHVGVGSREANSLDSID